MICYKCGCTLSEKDYCTGCGADVGMYKKILFLSNRYYNDALEMCQVRDLSGAIVSLKQSIKLNRNNVDAHNLLGLVYFEIGEVMEALGEWVISNSIRSEKNIATDYIRLISENQTQFDAMNQNLKKFNQALEQCYRDSLDYAIIHLKKVLSAAPNYLKAHQLLALICIRLEDWEKARHELEKCMAIDSKNIITMRYMAEVEAVLTPVDDGHVRSKKTKTDEQKRGTYTYKSGNDTIIQPVHKRQPRALTVLLSIGIGAVVGLAVAYFLILPAKIVSVEENSSRTIAAVSEEKDKITADYDSLQHNYNKILVDNEELNEKLKAYTGSEGNVGATDSLMLAAKTYIENPDSISEIARCLEGIELADSMDDTDKSESYRALYNKLMELTSERLSEYYHKLGYDSYKNDDFEGAIPNLQRAYKYNRSDGEALFYLAKSYEKTDQIDKAKEAYVEVINSSPDTERAQKAETELARINSQY